MKIVRAGTAALLVGLMAACANQTAMTEKAAPQTAAAAPATPPAPPPAPKIVQPSPQPLGPDEVNATNNLKYRYGETQVAVNPKNSNNIILVTQETQFSYACQLANDPDCQTVDSKLVGPDQPKIPQPRGTYTEHGDFNKQIAFVSFDRGKTWKRVQVPQVPKGRPNLLSRGDPSVTATPNGTFYFSWDSLDWGTPEAALPAAGVAISKSTDGGLTWSEPVLTGVPADGPKVTSDPTTGMIYAAGSSALGPISTGDPNAPFNPNRDRWLVSSKDGVHWTPPQGMKGTGHTSAAYGVLAAVFTTVPGNNLMGSANSDLCGKAPSPCVVFETTRDAGAHWSRTVMTIVPMGAGRAEVAADPTKAGHFAVMVPMNHDKEIDVYETYNSGKTWRGPAKVAEDTTKQHYHHWIAYSPNGILGILWRTRQGPLQGPNAMPGSAGFGMQAPTPYNVWAVISKDGGKTFSAPLEVSEGNSLPAQQGVSGGGDDYSGLALDKMYLYASWADWRPSERQNIFRAIKLGEFKAPQASKPSEH